MDPKIKVIPDSPRSVIVRGSMMDGVFKIGTM